MSRRVQSTGRQDTDKLIVEHVQGPRVSGVQLSMGDSTDKKVGTVILIVMVILTLFACGALSGTSQASRPSHKPWEGWGYILVVLGVVAGILLLMGLLYIGGRLYLSLAKIHAEAKAMDLQGRHIPADPNGSLGAMATSDRDAILNLDALPGHAVHGLKKAKTVRPKEPETDDERVAMERNATIRLALAAGNIPQVATDIRVPDRIREISPDAEEAEWLLLNQGEGVS